MDLDTAVGAAQGGDETAFRVVYRAVQPQLLQYVRSLVGPVDAEDVASEAWLQIARDLPNFRGDGASVRGWAARIARNRALDHIRARSRRPVSGAGVDELIQLPDRSDTAGEALDAVATNRALAAIAALPREQAEAVLLRVVMGLDSTSAARVLGKRAGSVRMATHRGLRRLAEILDLDDGDGDGHRGRGDHDSHTGHTGHDSHAGHEGHDGRDPRDGRDGRPADVTVSAAKAL
ncbi:RNA polymerase sigma factor [Streptomyces sp. NBC_01190]|uniref:RNA polymerase sigma factor n=1 Tax=Streptomyces sp. NBC_01190 TaxID=2903767 RepID=UPI003864B2E4|nr:RNA polymerase sigma factor [Streptomyces sp. NBC_01190]